MATSNITGTITDPTGVAVVGAVVVAKLMPSGGFRTVQGTEVAQAVATTTNSSGVYTLALEQNANITPANSYYEITESIPAANGGPKVWNISVGAADQSVYAALVTPLSPAQATYLTQAAADARYQALGSLGSSAAAETAGAAGTGGVSTSASRADHVHAAATGTPVAIGTALSAGSAATFAASDHVHTGPLGKLPNGYTERTANDTFNTAAEVTIVSATVTTVAGRRYRVTVDNARPSCPNNGDVVVVKIKEGATQLQRKDVPIASAGVGVGISFAVVLTPTAGSHTYSLTLQAAGGAGTSNTNAAVGAPAYILVEDIGT